MTLHREVRQRIKEAYEAGKATQEEIANLFGVCRNTVSRLWVAFQTTGSIEPKTGVVRGKPPLLNQESLSLLREVVLANNDSTDQELATLLVKRGGPSVSPRTINRALHKLGFTRKKRRFMLRNKIQNGSSNIALSSASGNKSKT
jgi:transposase